MYIVRERRRRWYSTEFMSHISRALFFILLSHLIVDFGQLISSRQQQQEEERLHDWGWLGMMIGARADPWEFRDDGMFDPRREIYWSNGSSVSDSTDTLRQRELATSSSDCGTAASSSPCCTKCFGLSYCDVLNGYKVEDKYYPGEPAILGSCDNFEERASRLDVFGPSKTFRDTEACREMVLDYTCLWWGSANEMYTNRCGLEAQVHPCRSYCVQLAKTCANNVLEWQELCRAIDCPPIDDECMPGPYAQDPDEACYIYEYHSTLNAGKRNCFAALSILLSVWFIVFIAMMATARGT